ncbi:prolipoprotein diacylglyceryl transferase [Proteocatella sphenisci]|uniref:prolipoprotein diacylglyceryl transferase n=1 Tax=Proteocatella sphenisci TaxID=181070 RepID=UPI00048D96F7|nr:prolipoprotein diacylglyceryl transferase [Proteocatella sphenisci]
MNPTAFTIFGIDIQWYAVIITSAMIIGVLFSIKDGEKQGFVGDHLLDLMLVALPLAIIGARAYYVIFNFEIYRDNIINIFNIRQGGLAIHGGLIGGFLGGYIVSIKKKFNIFKVADVISPYLILGQAIGRWGNYINQEAHGGPTDLPWGIMVDGVKVHPTFFYESIWNVMIFFVLKKIYKNKKYDGQMAAMYLILYSLGRFFIEGMRTDSLMVGPLRTAQVISVLLILLGASIMKYRKNKGISAAYTE